MNNYLLTYRDNQGLLIVVQVQANCEQSVIDGWIDVDQCYEYSVELIDEASDNDYPVDEDAIDEYFAKEAEIHDAYIKFISDRKGRSFDHSLSMFLML